MIHIIYAEDIQFDQGDVLVRAASAALQRVLNHEEVELTIAIEGDEQLCQLNRDFLGNNSTTDILSFPADEYDPDSQAKYIGDVVISYPQAERQAQKAGHPIINELQLLVIHGVLHLLGYDHFNEKKKSEMWRLQADILDKIGCIITQLPE